MPQEDCRLHLRAADFAGAHGAVDRGLPAHGRREEKHIDRVAQGVHGAQSHIGKAVQSAKKIPGLGLDL